MSQPRWEDSLSWQTHLQKNMEWAERYVPNEIIRPKLNIQTKLNSLQSRGVDNEQEHVTFLDIIFVYWKGLKTAQWKTKTIVQILLRSLSESFHFWC